MPTPRLNSDIDAFRQVMTRYHEIQSSDIAARSRAFKDKEFIADVEITARHALSPRQYQIWRLAFVWGRDRGFVRLRVGITTDLDMVLELDRLSRVMGAACKSVRPYPLFPLDDYFRPLARRDTRCPSKPKLSS